MQKRRRWRLRIVIPGWIRVETVSPEKAAHELILRGRLDLALEILHPVRFLS